MRTFYDLVRREGLEEIAEWLGIRRLITPRAYRVLPENVKEARKITRKSIGVFECSNIAQAKKMGKVEGAILILNPRIDAETVSIMMHYGSVPALTLALARKRFDTFVWNMHVLLERHYPPLLASWAEKPEEMRAPREIAAVGVAGGMSIPQALDAVSIRWRELLEKKGTT